MVEGGKKVSRRAEGVREKRLRGGMGVEDGLSVG